MGLLFHKSGEYTYEITIHSVRSKFVVRAKVSLINFFQRRAVFFVFSDGSPPVGV